MDMTLVIVALTVAVGIAGLLLQGVALRSTLSSGDDSPIDDATWPPVSILKPLAGLDDNLFGNLESFCHLDYPAYEIIFCLASPNDPAHALARKVRARHPHTPITIVVSSASEGHNPKVRNMLVPFLVTLLTCFMIYHIVPDHRVSAFAAFRGALFTGVLWEAAKHLFAVYVSSFGSYSIVYGSLGAAAVLLVWVYYSAAVLSLDAEVTALLDGVPARQPPP